MFDESTRAIVRRMPIDEARSVARSTLRRGSAVALELLAELDSFDLGWSTNPAAVDVGRPVIGEPRRVRLNELDELHLALLHAVDDVLLVVAEDEHARRTDRLRGTCAYVGERVLRWRTSHDAGVATIMRPSELGVPLCIYVCTVQPSAVGLGASSNLRAECVTDLARSIAYFAVPWDDSDALVFLARNRSGTRLVSAAPAKWSVPYSDDRPPQSMS